MDSNFQFLSAAAGGLLNEVLSRRNPGLYERVRQAGTVSRSDAELVMTVLSDELTDNLDDDWEPTEYGRTISTVMAEFNRARINKWP